MYEADHTPPTVTTEASQHLQSGVPGQWLLKSSRARSWQLDALVAEYPGRDPVQTHRDPVVVIFRSAHWIVSSAETRQRRCPFVAPPGCAPRRPSWASSAR